MKKKITFLMVIMLLLTGCNKITNNLDTVVDGVFTLDKVDVNTVSTNYELFIPSGVTQVNDREYNQKFKIKNRYIYLYVDTISYFYKNSLNYKQSDNYNYYFKNIDYNGKKGYIGINKLEDDSFFVEIIYNYSKIEFYSNQEDLPVMLANSLIIIKSIKYNDSLIKMQLDSGNNDGRELKYQLDSPKDTESTFSNFLQEFVPKEDNTVELPDEG